MAIAGGLLVLAGLVGLALPVVPGTVLLVAGLLVWSSEFKWAREALARVRAWLADRSANRQDKRWSRFRRRRERGDPTSG